ncbi:aldehyde dehydrogenase family protein [Kribbella sp. NPDC049227]|uniref:aldehyde dehydrogenase family protein n=1 Tax=Kribbella sp. NPDC049227 TaxID=3364113 RepID=UPI0037168B6F
MAATDHQLSVPELSSFIGGEWVSRGAAVPDTSPADPSELVATVSLADSGAATTAVDAAAAAAGPWSATSPGVRVEVLRTAADLLEQRAEQIGRDLTREEGKTLAESVRETQLSAKILRYYAAQALDPHGETFPSQQPGVLLFTRQDPVGVVSVITPWNFPISDPAWKIAPAVAFGNTVVWKPAEIVPLTSVHLVNALVDAGLPEGVLNLVLGKGSEVGEVLVRHPAVAAVTFTGSNQIGRLVHSKAIEAGKKVQLELGGKNPAVVLADAALDQAAAHIATAAFGASGQKCTATSRVIAHRSIADELVERLTAQAKAWQVGDPLDPETRVGPLSSADQTRTVLGYLAGARRDGARVVAGGARLGGILAKGYYVPPTVLVGVEPGHAIVRDEVFGPVLTVQAVDSFDQAVAFANDTPYGLAASLFTSDLGAALQFTEQSRAGIVKVNQPTSANEYHVPFGGIQDSGSGDRELGKAARQFYTEGKTISIGPADREE